MANNYKNRAIIEMSSGLQILIQDKMLKGPMDPLEIAVVLDKARRHHLDICNWFFPGIYKQKWMVEQVGRRVHDFIQQMVGKKKESRGNEKEVLISPFLILMQFWQSNNDLEPLRLDDIKTVLEALRRVMRNRTTTGRPPDNLGIWNANTLMFLGILAGKEITDIVVIQTIIERFIEAAKNTPNHSQITINWAGATHDNLAKIFRSKLQSVGEKQILELEIASSIGGDFIRSALRALEKQQKREIPD